VLALVGLPDEEDQLENVLCQSESLEDAESVPRAELPDCAPLAFESFSEARAQALLAGASMTDSERRLIQAELTKFRIDNGYGTTYAVYALADSHGRPLYIVQACSGGGMDYGEDFHGQYIDDGQVDSLFGESGWTLPGGTTGNELMTAARKKRIAITKFTRKRRGRQQAE
jgi:hypothetical protein